MFVTPFQETQAFFSPVPGLYGQIHSTKTSQKATLRQMESLDVRPHGEVG